ncbi:MAG: anti-sigma factor antagonist [Clostridia bacterium]|nr:anti-sigma factor antagonist [Clostridia bacterium]
MELNAQKRGPRLLVKLSGELDHHSAEQTRIMLDTLLRDVTVNELVLDLSGMTFMDSAGLGVVLGRFRKLSMRGGKLVVKGMNASIDRIFQMSGLYAIVERQ